MNPNEIPTLRPPPPIGDPTVSRRVPRRRYPYVCAEVVCTSAGDTRVERA